MVVKRITKISNPRRATAKTKSRKRLSDKQIKFFGSAAQRAGLKRRRSMAKANNPKRTHRPATRPATRKTYRPKAKNPVAHLLTFGLAGVNPKPRKKRRVKATMPATKKRRVIRKRTTAKSANPKKRIRKASHRRRSVPKASNPRRRRVTRVIVKNSHRRRGHKNPSLFGQSSAVEMGKMIVGGLAGVTITKAIPNMLPSSLTSSPIMRVVTSVVTAFAAGYLASKFADKTIGQAIMFGGLMQAGSVALNSFLPSVGATIGLQGLGGGIGDLVAGNYPVPQNPLFPQYNPGYGQAALPAPAPAHMQSSAPSLSGVGIFGSAF